MPMVSLLQVLAQNSAAAPIPAGGTRAESVRGLILAILFTGILLGACVAAARRERWPLVALLALGILGIQTGVLLFLTQLLAMPPV
jgi:hypothetical protein